MAQTWQDLEILVVDDGSDDQPAVCNLVTKLQTEEDDRIVYLQLPHNTGKWNALNKAIEQTNCQLITTLDADDTCLPERIERQVAALTATNAAHVLTGFHHCWSDEEITKLTAKSFGVHNLRIVQRAEVREQVLAGRQTPGINHYFTGQIETAGASAMFARDVWEMGIRFNPPGVGTRVLLSEDSDFNFRATALLGVTVILDEKLYCYRRNTSTNKEEM